MLLLLFFPWAVCRVPHCGIGAVETLKAFCHSARGCPANAGLPWVCRHNDPTLDACEAGVASPFFGTSASAMGKSAGISAKQTENKPAQTENGLETMVALYTSKVVAASQALSNLVGVILGKNYHPRFGYGTFSGAWRLALGWLTTSWVLTPRFTPINGHSRLLTPIQDPPGGRGIFFGQCGSPLSQKTFRAKPFGMVSACFLAFCGNNRPLIYGITRRRRHILF